MSKNRRRGIIGGLFIVLGCLIFAVPLLLEIFGYVQASSLKILLAGSAFASFGIAEIAVAFFSLSRRLASANHRFEIGATERKEAEKALREANSNLELKVSLRTAQLEKLNQDLRLELEVRQKAEEKLKKTAEELIRSNRELEDFAYVASHDLQEPLRAIASYLQIIQKRYHGKIDEDADEFINFAVSGAQRMKNLIIDLLAYARVGSHSRNFRSTDTSVVLDHALASLREPLKQAEATIHQAPLPTVMADSLQISQVFQNLIGNALKFRNGKPPEVKIAAWREGNEWIFSISDNGIGIESQYHERIFVIFERLHGQGDYPGTGVGLAICKKIIERHGGRIWLDSEPGKGSTFYFSLPAAEQQESI